MKNPLHFAACLKKLFTILIIILLAAHTSAYFIAISHEISFVQATGEKCETSVEEKKEKECTTLIPLSNTGASARLSYHSYPVDPELSRAKDILTPPPLGRHPYLTA